MQVVRRLVGVDADVRGLDAVDRPVEALLVDVADGLGERGLERRVEVVPEGPAATDDVLPHPALRLVQSRRDAVAKGRALERRRDAVLVEAVAALVHGGEDRGDVVFVVPRGQADVLGAGAGAERVHGQVEPRVRWVVAEPLDDLQRVRVLRFDRPWAVHEGVVAVHRADLGDQRHELGLQLVEDLAYLGGLHPRLVVVEEDVVRLVVAVEAIDVAALQLHGALEVGEEEGVVVVFSCLCPHVVGVGRGAGHLGGEVGRHAARLLPIASGRADQARVVGVVVELLLVAGEIVEQLADLVGDELLVRDPVERRHLVASHRAAAGGHHHGLVPEEDFLRAAQVMDLGQTCFQLGEGLFHRLSSDSRDCGRTLAEA